MIPALTGRAASAAAIAHHYGALLTGFVVHKGDSSGIESLAVCETDVIMADVAGRARLARDTRVFAARFGPRKTGDFRRSAMSRE
jgi:hypothetical protein